ncbi:unnamed protein product [Polarella glacialis]|uniref:Cold-shock domain-containing protein n=1 Tax=Polarella glacialis TaxID=89957 RepID=A0A813G3W0_POLGL|nr:unnamed protein product [Polarella glacialis]
MSADAADAETGGSATGDGFGSLLDPAAPPFEPLGSQGASLSPFAKEFAMESEVVPARTFNASAEEFVPQASGRGHSSKSSSSCRRGGAFASTSQKLAELLRGVRSQEQRAASVIQRAWRSFGRLPGQRSRTRRTEQRWSRSSNELWLPPNQWEQEQRWPSQHRASASTGPPGSRQRSRSRAGASAPASWSFGQARPAVPEEATRDNNNKWGRPGNTSSALSWEELLAGEHQGTVREWYEDRGFGFVQNARIHELCDHDVFFLRGQFSPEAEVVGAPVHFRVELDDAKRPRVLGASTMRSSSSTQVPLTMDECLTRVHEGVVCDFDAARGRGFIQNSRIHRLLGKDVLFHRAQFESVSDGDTVSFTVELDLEGRPRVKEPARSMALLGVAESGRGNAAAAVPMLRQPCLKELKPQVFTTEILLSSRHEGLVAKYGSAPTAGFVIRNSRILRLCGRDASVSAQSLAGHQDGDLVSFRVQLSPEGAPRAVDLADLGNNGCNGDSDVPLTIQELLVRDLRGVVAELEDGRNFGFIRCRQVQKLCGKDVFFYRDEFPGAGVGDVVSFQVSLDATGRPRTVEAMRSKEGSKAFSTPAVAQPTRNSAGPSSVEDLLHGEHEGVIKEFYAEKGYGFVTSQELLRLLGKDLFFRRGDLGSGVCAPGSAVRVKVEMDRDGRLKARSARSGSAHPEEGLFSEEGNIEELTQEEALAREHVGTITDYNPAKGYGFLRNPGIQRLSGHDVLLHKVQFWGREVGNRVGPFRVEFSSEGRARAVSVPPLEHASVPGLDSPPSPKCPLAFKILVSDSLAAAVIGRGGAGIAELWSGCGARVHVTPRGDCYPELHLRVLTLLAETEEMLVSAISQVIMMATGGESASGASHRSAPQSRSFADLQLRVLLPLPVMEDLESESGAGLQQLRDHMTRAYGGSIWLEREVAVAAGPGAERMLLVKGSSSAIKAATAALAHCLEASRPEAWFGEWAARTSTPMDPLFAWDPPQLRLGKQQSGSLTQEELTSKAHVGVIAGGSEFHAFIENDEIRHLTGSNVFVPKSQLWGLKSGEEVTFQVLLDSDGRPRATGLRPVVEKRSGSEEASWQWHSDCSMSHRTNLDQESDSLSGAVGEDPEEVEVALEADFGPMGLRFSAGFLPQVEAIRPEMRAFWGEQHGIHVGDRLLRVAGLSVEGKKPTYVLEQLSQRPVELAFLRLSRASRRSVPIIDRTTTAAETRTGTSWGYSSSWSPAAASDLSSPWLGSSWHGARGWEAWTSGAASGVKSSGAADGEAAGAAGSRSAWGTDGSTEKWSWDAASKGSWIAGQSWSPNAKDSAGHTPGAESHSWTSANHGADEVAP